MENNKKVIIYCRVSSAKQVREGNGLDSQEKICRAWAKQRGYAVGRVFTERGVSGAMESRPELDAMLAFLDKAKEKYIALFYDISRIARDTEIFLKIQSHIVGKGHELATTQEKIENTPVGKFLATIQAAHSQLFREENAIRTKNNMMAQVRDGYWLMNPPSGYRRQRIGGHIHLVFDEPTATYLREALEGFATARFPTQSDVVGFLKNKPIIYNGKQAQVGLNFVKSLLTNEIYTSVFSYEHWGIPRQQWHMPALISTDTFQAIQERLDGKKKVKPTKYNWNDEDFPLRRFVRCPACGRHLTGSRPRNKMGKHFAYYHCYGRGCSMRGKGIQQTELHSAFERVLAGIAGTCHLARLATRIIKEEYAAETRDWDFAIKQRSDLITAKTAEKEKTLSALIYANNDEVRKMCQERITTLAGEISALESEIQAKPTDPMPLNEATDYVMKFVQKPLEIWKAGNYYQKQGVLNLCFAEHISYDKARKFGTPVLSPIFALFCGYDGDVEKWCARQDSNSQSFGS